MLPKDSNCLIYILALHKDFTKFRHDNIDILYLWIEVGCNS